MKRTLLLIIAIMACFAIYAQGFTIQTPEGSMQMTITGVDSEGNTKSGKIIDMIVAKLEQLEKDYHSKLSKLDQKRAQNIVEEIYGLLALLPEDSSVTISSSQTTSSTTSSQPNININISGTMVEEKPTQTIKESPKKPEARIEDKPQKPAPKVEQTVISSRSHLSDSDFNDLIARIGKESFSDDKLRVLRTAAKNSRFNVNQITRLIGAYTYSEDKIQALQIAYPDCVDPHNNYKILDAFTYSSDKEEAEGIINSH